MTENKPASQEYNPDVCNYKHEIVAKDISGLKEKFEEHIVSLKEMIKENQKNDEKQNKQMENKFEVSQESINVKIDKFDEAFRGNGKIGVFEQIRDVKKDVNNINEKIDENNKAINLKFKIVLFLLILLVGGKVLGFSISTVREWFFPPKQTQQVNVEEIETDDNIINIKK